MLLTLPALLRAPASCSPSPTARPAPTPSPGRRFPFARVPSLAHSGRRPAAAAGAAARAPQSDVKGECLWERQVYVEALLEELRGMGLLKEEEGVAVGLEGQEEGGKTWSVSGVENGGLGAGDSPSPTGGSAAPDPPASPTPQLQESDIRTLLSDQYASAAFLAASGVGGKEAWEAWERVREERERELGAARRLRAGEGARGRGAGAGAWEEPRERVTRSDWSFCAERVAGLGGVRGSGAGVLGAGVLEQEEREELEDGELGLGEQGEGWEVRAMEQGLSEQGEGLGEEGEDEDDDMEWAERESGWHTPVGGETELEEMDGELQFDDQGDSDGIDGPGDIPDADDSPTTRELDAITELEEVGDIPSLRSSSASPALSPELAELRRIRAALFPDSADGSPEDDADPPVPELISPQTQTSAFLSPSTSWPSDVLLSQPAQVAAARRREAQKRGAIPDFLLTLPSEGERTSFFDMENGEGLAEASVRARARLEHWRADEELPSPLGSRARLTSPSTASVARPFLLPRTHEEYASDSDATDDILGPALPQAFPTGSRTSLPYVEQSRERSRLRTDARATYPAYPAHLHPNPAQEDSDVDVFYSPQPSLLAPSVAHASRTPSPRHSPYPAHLHPVTAQESDLYGGTLNAPDQSDRTSVISTTSSLSSLGTLVGPTSEAFVIERWDVPPSPDSGRWAREERATTPKPAPSPTQIMQTIPTRTPSNASTTSSKTSRIRRVPVPAYIPEVESEPDSDDAHTETETREVQTVTPELSVSAGTGSPLVGTRNFDSTSPTTPSSANDVPIFDSASSNPTLSAIDRPTDMRFQLAVDAPSRPSLEKRVVPSVPIQLERKESMRQKTKRVWSGMRVPRVRSMVRHAT
ncbi:hypothetical protein CALVIDRAFT_540466 [Calocera viscosa TUFC12733]|uniref:Uncharacterized protein n=1 Tax=Calocera viscosa (strain TUFC12733) TaxID=1330018 RepID=A0A167IVC0_CALVF|nr:hypothetical protein CALVIDRAFT_540466 [Calocera viscosa TUFC12733]